MPSPSMPGGVEVGEPTAEDLEDHDEEATTVCIGLGNDPECENMKIHMYATDVPVSCLYVDAMEQDGGTRQREIKLDSQVSKYVHLYVCVCVCMSVRVCVSLSNLYLVCNRQGLTKKWV